jgi:tubulin--tyrosine ligase-like protein 12
MTGGENIINGLDPYHVFTHQHKNQLETGGVPAYFWPTLHEKLAKGVFDAGLAFTLLVVQYDEGEWEQGDPRWQVQAQMDMKAGDGEHIYLVDHAWTFQTDKARENLKNIPGLADRMGKLMDIEDYDSISEEERLNAIMEAKWKFSQPYSIASAANPEDRQPIWYVMDEFGSRIQHTDTPNFRAVPFLYMGDGLGYSLLFPTCDVKEGDEATRDYVECPEASDPQIRECLLAAWLPCDLSDQDFSQKEPDVKFFLSGREEECLPDHDAQIKPLPTDRKIKVYAEYEFIRSNLTDARYELTENMADADILWLASHFKDFENFSKECPEKRINQFPFENVITIKDLLCVVSRRVDNQHGNGPDWLPMTFNLKTELREFVSCYQSREKQGLDNHWIIKPWNLARALDTQVARSLSHILRLPFSGPKIVQKYLHNPVLFDRPEIGKVKFDIRYIILLQSVKPLKVYAYNRFWLRFANIEFDLTELDVYEKHFTVMNYIPTNLKQMYCQEFIKGFEEQYPDFSWTEVEASIFNMIKGVFEGATQKAPPAGLGHCPQAGAMYATDLMLTWSNKEDGTNKMIPQMLEFNWMPDCERACQYYPEFFNNVFNTLFLNETEGQNVILL